MRLAEMEKHSLELKRREISRQRWQAMEAREAAEAQGVKPDDRSSPPERSGAPKAAGAVLGALDRLANSMKARKAK